MRWRRGDLRPEQYLRDPAARFEQLGARFATRMPADKFVDRRALQLLRDDPAGQVGVSKDHIHHTLRDEILSEYQKFGFTLHFGLVLPGWLVGRDVAARFIELYFFEPDPEGRAEKPSNAAIQSKLSLLPLLQEVATVAASAEQRAQALHVITSGLVLHEIRHRLLDELSILPHAVRQHLARCLDAYTNDPSGTCTADHWREFTVALKAYTRHRWSASNRFPTLKIRPWPHGLKTVALRPSLLYAIAWELVGNAEKEKASTIEVGLDFRSRPRSLTLTVTSNGEADIPRLKDNLKRYSTGNLAKATEGGLGLITKILQALGDRTRQPIEADQRSGKVTFRCHLPADTEVAR